MNNQFRLEVMPDGKIKVTSAGGFSAETHHDADDLLKLIQQLAGGTTETKRLQPSLGNPHAQQHGHHGHNHHH